MLTDVRGKELEVGQLIATNPPYYKGLVLGVIDKICAKKVRVSVIGRKGTREFYTFADDVAILKESPYDPK